jgi:hypothetical protein
VTPPGVVSDLNPDIDSELEIKRLTPENWLEVDHNSSIWVRPSVVGPIAVRPQEWAERLLAVDVDKCVPLNVRRLFAVARGAMIYGSFFYPLWAVGSERLFAVADAAVAAKYEAEGGTRKLNGRLPPYRQRLEWLRDHGTVSDEAFERWDTLRQLRNAAAHPESQSIFPPTHAVAFLTNVAHDIDTLFS